MSQLLLALKDGTNAEALNKIINNVADVYEHV